MKDLIQANAKALTALFSAVLSLLVLKYALHLGDEVTTALASLVVSVLVWLVPNSPPAPALPPATPPPAA